jgi:hypothetical protein
MPIQKTSGLRENTDVTKAKCKLCEDVIESKHRHDYVACKCGEIFLDGGESYLRGGSKSPDNFVLLKGLKPKSTTKSTFFKWEE